MKKMDCALCGKEVGLDGEGICLKCQQKVLGELGVKVEFLDEDPYVKVTPKDKTVLYDLVTKLSELFANVDYNYHAVTHHSHATKTVEVVDVE